MSPPGDVPGGAPPFSEGAFERLYRETFATVYSIGRRAARDQSEAEDVSQRAYLALYGYWSAGRLREAPEHLLYRVAKNGAIDLLRRRRRDVAIDEARATASSEGIGGALYRALRRLRPEDASLVLLQAAGGFSYEELGRIERRSVAAVRSRLFRARRELARLYDEEGGEW